MKLKATHILWDVDHKSDLKRLPNEIDIPAGMSDDEEISDYLSDVTGFCHRGFVLEAIDPAAEESDSITPA